MNKDLYRAAVNEIKPDEKILKELKLKMKDKQPVKAGMSRYRLVLISAAAVIVIAFALQSTGLIGRHEAIQLKPGSTIALSNGKGSIYVNKTGGKMSAKIFIPQDAYSKDYTLDQLSELLGRSPLPEMPKGFKADVIKTNVTFDSKGKILFMSSIIYSTDTENPEAPSIEIKLNKDQLPPRDLIYVSKPVESVINGTKVTIGAAVVADKFDNSGKPAASYELYSAQFIYNGIGYDITGKRVSGQEFIKLIEDILSQK